MDNAIQPWREVEISLSAANDYNNVYTQVEVWADFTHSDGTTLRRPAFWDRGQTWRIRFTSPHAQGECRPESATWFTPMAHPVCWSAIQRGRCRGALRLISVASTRKTASARASMPRC
ncbi:MAG TPA: DUF5060 domain-containing protein [Abditibacteriaceae bacterium]